MRSKLGNTGLSVSKIALGGNVFGWTVDKETSFKILDYLEDLGGNFIDTADVYSTWKAGNTGGESEKIIGSWQKSRGNRDSLVIATKVGGIMDNNNRGLSKQYIIKAAEASLRRLKTDYIDLYQSHYDDATTPIEETLEAYQQLIKEGKVRYIGASNISPQRFLLSLKMSTDNTLPSYDTLQPEYNLYDRQYYETAFEQDCIRNKIGVITYFSLASGFLTGKYRNVLDLKKSERGKRVQKYLNERGHNILNALDHIAIELNSKPSTIAISWLLSKPSITAAIVSATNLTQLQELFKAADLKLMDDHIETLNSASSY
ncbi:aldo/keto reductase [Pedobacter caeni]|uniref:Predicted oxidoreductase n=1 Tax=Pedobacter caeni TaxID=288992 RepID=A0A1M5PRT9_9SPHI|nr:aldo/keto reductase [Pedobacter caeni]SHH04239.1 Predicted oxidoreductase [Pedobacter caeni]